MDGSQDVEAQGTDPVVVGLQPPEVGKPGKSPGWEAQHLVVAHVQVLQVLEPLKGVIFNLGRKVLCCILVGHTE